LLPQEKKLMSPKNSLEALTKLQEFPIFLDGAIHGIRAGLRGIGTSAALLSREWNERFDEESRSWTRSILDGVTNLNNLTASLSDYSMALARPKIPSAAPLPVGNALQTAIQSVNAMIQDTGATVYAGQLPKLAADHEQLAVLFRCLLNNALEYRDINAAPRIEITATAAGNEWRFAVSDNGIGIAPNFHRQIFEPFKRLHADTGAFGLGLTIARMIVTSHGGRLWVDSREGEGSTFFFTLPMDGPA
jgi:light-regulated signal transduction histidine kinase (bacteriophytochrome)